MAKGKPAPEPEQEEVEELEDAKTEGRRLSEMAGSSGGGSFEGELLTLEQLDGREVTVLDFKFLPSTFKEGEDYACIQVELDGIKHVINTTATVIVKDLKKVDKAGLPAPVKFVMTKGKGKYSYWNME